MCRRLNYDPSCRQGEPCRPRLRSLARHCWGGEGQRGHRTRVQGYKESSFCKQRLSQGINMYSNMSQSTHGFHPWGLVFWHLWVLPLHKRHCLYLKPWLSSWCTQVPEHLLPHVSTQPSLDNFARPAILILGNAIRYKLLMMLQHHDTWGASYFFHFCLTPQDVIGQQRTPSFIFSTHKTCSLPSIISVHTLQRSTARALQDIRIWYRI